MSTRELLRGFTKGYHDFTRCRADAVRAAVEEHGLQRGADPYRIETACQQAEAQFRRDPSSGHRAIEWGRLWIDRPRNVIPLDRARRVRG